MVVFAYIGALALWLLYLWLGSAVAASWLSQRKGWGSSVGLAFGLLLSVLGVAIWLLVPSRRRWEAFRHTASREAERVNR
jgi:hypothetical protein